MSGHWFGMTASRLAAGLGLALGLGACTVTSSLDSTLKTTSAMSASPDNFIVCFAHGCQRRAKVSLSADEWSQVAQAFVPAPQSADEERQALRTAIATMETIVGEKTGTAGDVGGSFTGFGKRGQLDCVDEMMNTATYVQLMISEGLVTRHELGQRLTNTFFSNGNVWPHTAMTIAEIDTGDEWAIDSWWLKNGAKPYIVTAEAWSSSKWQQPRSGKAKKVAEADDAAESNISTE